ncbi:MAG: phospholipase D-like domain-containing protein, partial [Clostridiales bacterium]
MSIIRFLTSRLAIIAMLIVIQFAVFFFMVVKLSTYTPLVYVGFVFFSFMVAVYVMSKDDNPSYKILWTVVILAVPLFGGICYFLFGNKRLPKKVRSAAAVFNSNSLSNEVRDNSIIKDLQSEDRDLGQIAKYLDNTAGFPVWTDTEVKYFSLGEHKYFAMLEELEKAQSYILLEYFIIHEGQMWNNIHNILKEKVKAGVDVYVLYDDMGCINTLPHGYDELLRSEGMKVIVFNPFKPHLSPLMNYRDHRKILVVDGKVAFCGGVNLADEYINKKVRFGHWKDSAVMLKGDAVWNLTDSFFKLWNFACLNLKDKVDIYQYRHTIRKKPADGYVQPFSDSPLDFENVSENFFLNVINKATDYVYITTPYLVIDHEMQTALCLAAKNGVDVRIVTPGIPDKKMVYQVTRSFYLPLIEA